MGLFLLPTCVVFTLFEAAYFNSESRVKTLGAGVSLFWGIILTPQYSHQILGDSYSLKRVL